MSITVFITCRVLEHISLNNGATLYFVSAGCLPHTHIHDIMIYIIIYTRSTVYTRPSPPNTKQSTGVINYHIKAILNKTIPQF